jgi:flagellar basal-body rod protein FlgB
MEMFNRTFNLLSSMADFRSQRHKVIVSNISNMDVANYESTEITFKKELGSAIAKEQRIDMVQTDPRHIPGTSGTGNYDVVATGERVKIDKEMGNLAENQLMYNLTIELLARKFRGLKNVLTEAK